MATEITMPKLSDTMTEGRLIAWKRGIGEKVERGDVIAEVETDKANMELEAFASGILLETRVKPGEMVPVGTVIGIIGEAGEAPRPKEQKAKPEPQTPWQPPQEVPSPAAMVTAPEKLLDLPEAETAHPAPEAKASPLVRRLARERGVDLSLIQGSGPEGRIIQSDLEGYARGQGEIVQEALDAGGAAVAEPLSRIRNAIAKTVSESWRTIPHFFVTVEIEMKEAGEIVRELKGTGSDVTFNDLVIKAVAMALEKFPRLNASFAGGRVVVHSDINIGFAVAVDDGLQVPVIKGCRSLSLKEVAVQSLRLTDRARSGTINQEEISGGTFSVSNLGMFGVEEFAAVILPPQAAILAVGEVAERPVVKDGHVVPARTMKATLSADHRLIDGAYAAQFLGELKRILENPVVMLVK